MAALIQRLVEMLPEKDLGYKKLQTLYILSSHCRFWNITNLEKRVKCVIIFLKELLLP